MASSTRLPPGPLVVGYATSRAQREASVLPAAARGVNVVIWAFAHLEYDEGTPVVRPTFDLEDIRATKEAIAAKGLRAAHLCAFGGWNGPHPDPKTSGGEWFEAWRAWNAAHGDLFDGVDWDLEGHDAGGPTAVMSPRLVTLVADFSKAARAAGFAVALAPAESYLDGASRAFNLRLDNEPLAPWTEGLGGYPGAFPYAGRNAYAAIVREAGVDAFDLVSVQLYEGYSRACHALTQSGEPLGAYLAAAAARLVDGFEVDFPEGPATVSIPREKLCFGFANGWADNTKFLRAAPEDVAAAIAGIPERHRPRGVMFWVIDEEENGYSFAAGLSRGGGDL